jgi:hypothetical protein
MEFDSIIRPRLITTKTGLTNRSSERAQAPVADQGRSAEEKRCLQQNQL